MTSPPGSTSNHDWVSRALDGHYERFFAEASKRWESPHQDHIHISFPPISFPPISFPPATRWQRFRTWFKKKKYAFVLWLAAIDEDEVCNEWYWRKES